MPTAPRSNCVMRVRRSASTSALPCGGWPAGPARRDSPIRFGLEPPSPTLRNPLRGHALGLGSGREIRCKRSDGGVGGGTVGSMGTLSQQPRQRQLECRCVRFLFQPWRGCASRSKGEQKERIKVAGAAALRCKFSTAQILPTGESIRQETGMPHRQSGICQIFRRLPVHPGNS